MKFFLQSASLLLLVASYGDAASLRKRTTLDYEDHEEETASLFFGEAPPLDLLEEQEDMHGQRFLETYPDEETWDSDANHTDPEDIAPVFIDEEVVEEDENISTLDEEEEPEEEDMEEETLVDIEIDADEEESLIPTEAEVFEGEGGNVTVEEDPEELAYELRRQLHAHMMHGPLACNEGIDWTTTTCTSFATLLQEASSTIETSEFVIPCGQCYQVDITDGSTVTLPSGLRIEGKLYFPSSASVTLRATLVWVLGILKVDAPAEGNLVKISLFGEESQTFIANDATSHCGEGCSMGSKVIAVHGGQLDIQGVEEGFLSWEKLQNIHGEGDVRPFINHLPSSRTGESWTSGIVELTGRCRFSQGHTDNLGKNTVYCPIKGTGAHIGTGTNLPIKLTSIGAKTFEYPTDKNDQTLSLTMRSACGVARGHTRHFKKCVMYCPIQTTAKIGSGHGGSLVFTSTKPDPAPVYQLPSDKRKVQPTLKLRGPCRNSYGHSRAWKRCTIYCPLQKTATVNGGSHWGKLEMTSVYHPPTPFPKPKSRRSKEPGSFVLQNKCVYMAGHTRAWRGCVIRCPLQKTYRDMGAYHKPAWLVNPATGEKVATRRIMQWAHAGRNMFMLLQDVSRDNCAADGANTVNSVFSIGDTLEPSYQMVDDNSKDGSTMSIDKVLHFSHRGGSLYFFPSDKDSSPASCDATVDQFNDGFPAGYEIKVDYPPGPEGGETFNVNRVHHWSWGGRTMYLFPENEDTASCGATVKAFNDKFPAKYGISVSGSSDKALGAVVTASLGVHHWSWNQNSLFFHPDESEQEINAKFTVGHQLEVSFMDSIKDYYEVQVSSAAASHWKPGSEVLLTSHTHSWKDEQVRTIESSNPETGMIRFTSPIAKPITVADDPVFAVEIASLNRRVVFDAENDAEDDMIGGHLVIHHTPAAQHIEGVEIKNFGQGGRLGKYPLHFHMCGDSPESLVKKNVVRNSNQRCYVAHLTNQLTFEENVAHNAFGHCYFIEDGRETGNVFRKNLGSGIKIMPDDRVEQLEAKSGREETDGSPFGFNGASAFWISNPQNYFHGNIAAGGQKNGFWIETRGSRGRMNLGAFEDNEVHSHGAMAFTVYHPGWRPEEMALIKNIKVYRNPSWGAFLHVTKNLYFQGGIFADNGAKAVMINRGDNLTFVDTTFIGKTSFTPSRCSGGEKIGISLHPSRLAETVRGARNIKGLVAKNLHFKNWSPEATQCNPAGGSMPLKFHNQQSFIKAMNAYHYFENIHVDDTSSTVMNACLSGSMQDVSIEVGADDFNGMGGSHGFLVSPQVATMVPTGCTPSALHACLDFCPGACLRTITVLGGDSAFGETMVMIVSDGTNEITVHRDVHGHPGPNPKSNNVADAYTVVLPKGSYIARFESLANPGVVVWPRSAVAAFESAPTCSNYIVPEDFEFLKPIDDSSQCTELIHNGNFDSGEWGIEGWNGFHNWRVEHKATEGVGGSGALATTHSSSGGSWPNQEIDVTCLEEGAVFEITAYYKLVDADMNELLSSTGLPFVRAKFESLSSDGQRFQNIGYHTLGHSSTAPTAGNWGVISSQWTVTAAQANAARMRFHIAGGPDRLLIDNVSCTRVGV